jgi:hypothetical protein
MNAFTVYILICTSSIPVHECNSRNAENVMLAPENNTNLCGLWKSAEGTIFDHGHGEYAKMICAKNGPHGIEMPDH